MDRTFSLDDEIENIVRDIDDDGDEVVGLEQPSFSTETTEPAPNPQPFEFVSFDSAPTNSTKNNGELATVQIEIGQTRIEASDTNRLVLDSVVELDESSDKSVTVLADGKIVAKGELVVIDGKFAVRLTERNDG